jgi:hypothetical protein
MRFVAALTATGLLLAWGSSNLFAYPLTLEQRERFDRYLPRTFVKLEVRDPVHVVLLGDSVSGGYRPAVKAKDNNNPLYSYTGIFLAELAREFFYPGGVHLLNPPPKGVSKLTDYLGDEITFENLSEIDGTMLDGLRHISTDAFLHDPDLLLIQYGIYDAFGRVSIDTYKRALQEIIDTGRRRPVDMILMGPGLVNYGGSEMQWGLVRPYSMAAKEVAAANGVLFIDTGQLLAKFGGGVDPATHPKAVMEILTDRLSRIFNHGPEWKKEERVHTSDRVNAYLGEAMFDELKDGPRTSPFSFAGVAEFAADGLIDVTVAVRNQTDEVQEGTIGSLAVGNALIPADEPQRFSVPAQATTQLSFRFRRPIVGKARDGSDVLFPLEPSDEFARFSFFLENVYSSEVVELPLRIGPVTAVWKSRQFINVTDQLRVEWDLVNGTDKAISGTFQVGMGEKVGQPTSFSVSPLGTKSVFSLFDFVALESQSRFQRDIWIQLDVNGIVTRFTREMEATRDLVLGEEMELASWAAYVNAVPAGETAAMQRSQGKVTTRFDADDKALYVISRLEGISLPDLGDQASLRARLFLDARPMNQVLTFGAVEPVEVFTKGMDGPGFTPGLQIGSFGTGYNMVLAPQGIGSVLKTDETGARVLEVRIPRSYFHLHEWTLDSLSSLVGIRIELTVADSNPDAGEPFPLVNSYVTNSPTFSFENRVILGFSESDARSLSALRLARRPVGSWTVRIY